MTTPRIEEISFEKYLEQVCFEANPTVLDDFMPDFFDDWLVCQDGEDYIRLANKYANQAHQAGRDEAMEMVLAEIDVLRAYPLIHRDMRRALDVINDTIKALQDNK